MRKILVLAIVVGGIWQLSQHGLPTTASVAVYDESGDPLVKVISIENCGVSCRMATDELKRRRVAFEEVIIDPHDKSDDSENFRLWKRAGRDVFPLVVAGDQLINGSGTPAQMASLLARNFDDKYLTDSERRYFRRHFDTDGSPRVVVYGADWCPHTKKLREQLDDDDVDYVMVDVDKSADKLDMIKSMEIGGYPVAWVGYSRARGSDISHVNRVLDSY